VQRTRATPTVGRSGFETLTSAQRRRHGGYGRAASTGRGSNAHAHGGGVSRRVALVRTERGEGGCSISSPHPAAAPVDRTSNQVPPTSTRLPPPTALSPRRPPSNPNPGKPRSLRLRRQGWWRRVGRGSCRRDALVRQPHEDGVRGRELEALHHPRQQRAPGELEHRLGHGEARLREPQPGASDGDEHVHPLRLTARRGRGLHHLRAPPIPGSLVNSVVGRRACYRPTLPHRAGTVQLSFTYSDER
jgi:hypothetical protein